MRTFIGLFLVLAFYPPAHAETTGHSLKTIDWLLGEWNTVEKNLACLETWVQVSPATWEGTGETRTAGNQIISFEALRMVEMSGQVFYLAKPLENKLPVPFLLIEGSAQHAIFANPDHDFPQRLEYRLDNSRTLFIRVSGQGREISLRLKRTKKVLTETE